LVAAIPVKIWVNLNQQVTYLTLVNYFSTLLFILLRLRNKKDFFENHNVAFFFQYIVSGLIFVNFIYGLISHFVFSSKILNEEIDCFFLFIVLGAVQCRYLIINTYKNHKIQFFLGALDLIFCTFYLLKSVLPFDFSIIAYFYCFRLLRLLYFVPYFERILNALWQGLKIGFHYVISFFIVIVILTVSSKILFTALPEKDNFSSFVVSFFNNFKISLGNGFDIANGPNRNSLIFYYVIILTFLMGVIFSSILTASITDGMLKNKDEITGLGIKHIPTKLWWKKPSLNEANTIYNDTLYMRIINRCFKI